MDRDDPAYRGQSDYTRPLLALYDPLVLGLAARFVWLDRDLLGDRSVPGIRIHTACVTMKLIGSPAHEMRGAGYGDVMR